MKQEPLIELGPPGRLPKRVKRPKYPVWTENKAKLIERYLYYFVLVTKHGTYVDGFAGPQTPDKPDMWAAKLVLESEPRWLRHFHFFEVDAAKIQHLEDLVASQLPRRRKEPKRTVSIVGGDFNELALDLLASNTLKKKEATFCLLDQRTFECKWSTVRAFAEYKRAPLHKIELFYFLQSGWFNRAESALRDRQKLEAWWGRNDFESFAKKDPASLKEAFVERFRDELGYESVEAWPIYERSDGGRIMYYMIHATDHPEAPKLMARAYDRAVQPKETIEQLRLEFRPKPASP